MTSNPVKTAFVNIFGTLGYMSVIFQWLWTIVLLAHPLLSSDLRYLLPAGNVPTPTDTPKPVSPLAIGLVIILTVIVFAATFYALWKLPSAIGKGGKQVTKRAARALLPVMIHPRKPTDKKERQRLSATLIRLIKLAFVLLPLAGLMWASPVGALGTDVIWVIGLFCAVCSLVYFCLQQLLAAAWHIPSERVW